EDLSTVRGAAFGRRVAVTVAIASIGIALAAVALAANAQWFDRHFLPSFFLPRRWYVAIHETVRWTLIAAGAALAVSARSLGRALSASAWRRALPIAAAAVLALGASEVVLRRVHVRPAGWLLPEEEPRRQADVRLGWTLVPGRVGQNRVGGRSI